jgi:hypothetical protein
VIMGESKIKLDPQVFEQVVPSIGISFVLPWVRK